LPLGAGCGHDAATSKLSKADSTLVANYVRAHNARKRADSALAEVIVSPSSNNLKTQINILKKLDSLDDQAIEADKKIITQLDSEARRRPAKID
jgi:hypothetical protein